LPALTDESLAGTIEEFHMVRCLCVSLSKYNSFSWFSLFIAYQLAFNGQHACKPNASSAFVSVVNLCWQYKWIPNDLL